MNSPVVSFQLESEEAFTKLLQLVEEALESSKQVKNEKTDTKEGTSDKERANQFKVICLNFCSVELMYSCFLIESQYCKFIFKCKDLISV